MRNIKAVCACDEDFVWGIDYSKPSIGEQILDGLVFVAVVAVIILMAVAFG